MTCSNVEESTTPYIAFGNGEFSSRSKGFRLAPLFANLLLAIAALSLAARPAAATPLPIVDGDDFVPTSPVGDPTSTLHYLVDETNTVTTYNPDHTVDWTANVESSVYSGLANNPYVDGEYGTVAGAMTFVYQITVTSPTGDVGQLDISDFGASQTEVGYFDKTQFTDQSEILPTYVDRDAAGPMGNISTISFLFFPTTTTPPDPPSQFQVIDPGQYSALLVVNTDATTYSSSYAELQDGANGVAPSFAVYGPMPMPTPEPASVVLMVLGFTGLLAVARARRSSRPMMPAE